MPTTFYIVRHGQSEGNVNGDVMGGNPPLTKVGIEQAQALANLLEPIKIDFIFSSNLIRAKQTAQIIAKQKKLIALEDERIKERYFGEIEGLKGDVVSYKEEIELFQNIPLNEQMNWRITDGMESLNEVLERVLPFFDSVESNKSQTILMVTHANVLLALLAHFGFINSFKELPYGSILNTSYLKIEKDKNTIKIIETLGINKFKA